MMEGDKAHDEGSSDEARSYAMMRPRHDLRWWQDIDFRGVRVFFLGLLAGAIVGLALGIAATLTFVWAGQYRYEVDGGDEFVYILDRKTGRINVRNAMFGHLWVSSPFVDYDRSPGDRLRK